MTDPPGWARPGDGDDSGGEGALPHEQPQYGQPQYGQPPAAPPSYGQPQYGYPGSYGQPGYGPVPGYPMGPGFPGQPGFPPPPPPNRNRTFALIGAGIFAVVLVIVVVVVIAMSGSDSQSASGSSGVTATGPTSEEDQIRDLMTSNIETLGPDATAQDAAIAMRRADTGSIPVVEDNRVVGLITDRDIAIRAVAEGRGPDCSVRDLMSADPNAEGGDVRNVYKVGLNTSRLLMALGDVVCAWLLLRGAQVALDKLAGEVSEKDQYFYEGKIAAAQFFAQTVLPRLSAERRIAEATDLSIMDLDESAF